MIKYFYSLPTAIHVFKNLPPPPHVVIQQVQYFPTNINVCTVLFFLLFMTQLIPT